MSQQINLFNPIFLKQKKAFSAVSMVDALALLLVGVSAFYAYGTIETLNLDRQAVESTRHYDQAKAHLRDASARYAPKKTDAALQAEVNNLQAQLDARNAAFNAVAIGAPVNDASYAEYMRAFARQSLAGLWLTGFKLGKGGAEIEIVGRALRPELVPAYIRRLGEERVLRGRAFDSLSMKQAEGVLPADAARPAGAPARYRYTEFRLGSSHAELPAEEDAQTAGSPAPAEPAGTAAESQPPAPNRSGGSQ